MPRRARFSELPDDIVASILARLPPAQIPRARFVCRRWRALTTDYHFLRTALAFSRRAGHTVAGGFFLYDRSCLKNDPIRNHFLPFQFPFDGDHEAEAAAEDGLAAAASCPAPDLAFILGSTLPPEQTAGIHVASSCNGLLLLFSSGTVPRPHYVCNPLTKEVARLAMPYGRMNSSNLAFDPSISRHYKVVTLDDMYGIHVYSSDTRCWRMAVHPDHSAGLLSGLRSFRAVFWNGSMVWTLGHSLVRFVLEGEYLVKVPMPPKTKTGWMCAYFGESAGHLQMIGYTKEEKLTACFDILEMQRDQLEWSVLYRIDLGRVKELYPDVEWPTWDTRGHEHKVIGYLALSPVCVIRGTGKAGKHGVLIFSIPGMIMAYNMEDMTISMIQEAGSSTAQVLPPYNFEHPWYNIYAYHPSLFTL